MNFENIHISHGIQFFKKQILKTYPNLKLGWDPNKPCIFFGIYNQNDINAILNHKSQGLIIWGGSDSMRDTLLNFVKQLDKSRFFSIAQSKWVSDDLKRFGILHKQLPWYSLDKESFRPIKKGKKVYIYMPTNRKIFYGNEMYMSIKKHIDYEVIVGDGKIPYEKMTEIYAECFIGLRLVPHDGLGSTVQEMGLMGIKCVHNGNSPSALNYKTVDDIIVHIEKEAKTIDMKDEALAKKVDEYLNIRDDFFHVKSYWN
jgi:hypothetical protein